MGPLAEAYLKLGIDDSAIDSGLAGVRQRITSSLGSIANVGAGMLAAAGIQQAGSFLASLGDQAIRASAELETLQTSFTVMLKGNAAAAEQLVSDIQQLAAVTPFDTAGLARATQGLLGVGVAAKDTLPMLTKLGDAAAASIIGMEALPRLMLQVTQMIGKGKISAADMRPIAELGIPAWKILADKMGVSVAKVQELSAAGKLGAKEVALLIDGLGEKFPGMMDKQSKTWGGLMSTMKDNWKMMLVDIGQPFFALAKDMLAGIVKWSQSDSAKMWIGRVRDGIKYIIELVKSGLQSPVVQAIGKFAALAGGATLVASAVAGIAVGFNLVLGAIGPILAPVAALAAGALAVYESFQMALSSPQGAGILTTLREIGTLAVEIGQNFMDTFSQVFTFLSTQWNAMFGDEFQATNASFWASLVGGVRDFMDWVSLLSTDWGMTWQLMGKVAELGMVTIGDLFRMSFDGFKQVFAIFFGQWDTAWFLMTTTATAAVQAISDLFKQLIDKIQGALSAMFASIEPILQKLNIISEGAGENALKAFGEFKTNFDVGTKAIADAFKSGGAGGVMKSIESPEAKALKDEIGGLVKAMGAERAVKREQREKERKAGEKPPEIKGRIELPGADGKAAEVAGKDRKSSFVGLEEMAKSIQSGLKSEPMEKVAAGVEKLVLLGDGDAKDRRIRIAEAKREAEKRELMEEERGRRLERALKAMNTRAKAGG